MRIVNWAKSRWHDHIVWRAFKRQTINTFGKPGFNSVTYKGASIERENTEAIARAADSLSKQFMGLQSTQPIYPELIKPDPMTSSINELLTTMDEASKEPPFDEHQAKLDIINKRLGV